MSVHQKIIIGTEKRGIYDITEKINQKINKKKGILCNIFCQHTSASLIFCENYDILVKNDIENFFSKLVKEDNNFMHVYEGKDDMPAHIRTIMTNTNATIPIINNKLYLGRWQSICLFEHRYLGQTRNIVITITV